MSDILSAISVFLVFLTFLLKTIDEDISFLIKERNPLPDKPIETRSFKNRSYKLLFLKAIPITFIYSATAYCLLPKTIHLMRHGRIDFWTFDPLNTLFIFIELGIIALAIYAGYKTIKLVSKIKSVK